MGLVAVKLKAFDLTTDIISMAKDKSSFKIIEDR